MKDDVGVRGVRMVLHIDRADEREAIEGWLRPEGEEPQRFEGWLELLTLLQALDQRAREGYDRPLLPQRNGGALGRGQRTSYPADGSSGSSPAGSSSQR